MQILAFMVRYVGYTVIALATATVVMAQSQRSEEDQQIIEEVVSIGTRSPAHTALDLPVPVDAVSINDLRDTGQTEVGRMIQALVPSFNFSSSTISDGTDSLRPATLRGLGPDQTLVLVNGKRRHASALVHVNTSVGRGTAGTDINAIPQIALKRVEVLRDGASAQYGSDAIAGAINLVLEDSPDANRFAVHYGGYTEGDGANLALSVFNGGAFLSEKGKWSIAVEYRDRDPTNRAGLTGQCQYYGACTQLSNGDFETTDSREIAFDRNNFRIGDANSSQISGVINVEAPISANTDFYFFSTLSRRNNESGGFYRRANQSGRNPTFLKDGTTQVNGGAAYIADGFLPLIQTSIRDSSVDLGFTGAGAGAWGWDASFGYGNNSFAFDVVNSLNASHVANLTDITTTSPRSAYAGKLVLQLLNLELSANRPMSWGHLAFGAAVRQDKYQLRPGEELSWRDYDTDATGTFTGTGTPGTPSNFSNASGGIQVFPGYRPANAVNENRNSIAAYVDVEWDTQDRLFVGGAARFENYEDFGNTLNVKGTLLYRLHPTFSVRGALSTGFRAPSLQQQYFNNISTQFNSAGVAQEVGTFRNDSAVVRALGVPELKQETSINLSAGLVFKPLPEWSVTVDYYRIDIEDRVVLSNRISSSLSSLPMEIRTALMAIGNNVNAQFFLNAANTRTQGVDVISEYSTPLGSGDLRILFGMNWTDTKITRVTPPQSLSSVAGIQDLIFPSQSRSILTEWQPEWHGNFTARYDVGALTFSATARFYGEYTVEDGPRQTFGDETLLDVSISYEFAESLTFTLGGNNITNQKPDQNTIGQSRAGRIVDDTGRVIVDSPGVFTYSRRAAPFGFNGAYIYGSLIWAL